MGCETWRPTRAQGSGIEQFLHRGTLCGRPHAVNVVHPICSQDFSVWVSATLEFFTSSCQDVLLGYVGRTLGHQAPLVAGIPGELGKKLQNDLADVARTYVRVYVYYRYVYMVRNFWTFNTRNARRPLRDRGETNMVRHRDSEIERVREMCVHVCIMCHVHTAVPQSN